MKVFNAVVVCERDAHLMKWHADAIDGLGVPMQRRFYFGTRLDGRPCSQSGEDIRTLGVHELYENLPVKVCCMFKDALTVSDWTHLLKTDVNSRIEKIDWAIVQQEEMIGYVAWTKPARSGHRGRVAQSALNQDYDGPLPSVWCGGPAYAISRRLAQCVADRGVWSARSHAYEDTMVALIAAENGIVPKPGIWVETDGRVHRQ